ncbi:Rubisco LSMT substrate-binding protein [Gracilaria domingensis]|nr:Rubisco LSMT substrate-binding protein [Gracilaria domingensis]
MSAFISCTNIASVVGRANLTSEPFRSSFAPRHRRRLRQFTNRMAYRVEMSAVKSTAVDECITWLKSNSGNVKDVLDFSFLETRSKRGVSAGKKILERTEMVTLPEGTYLGMKEAKKLLDEASPGFSSSGAVTESGDYVALALLLERSKGSNSYFAPFLKTLPEREHLDCIPLWSTEEHELLRGSTVYLDVKDWLKSTEEEWEALDDGFFQKNRGVFPEESFTLRDYRWALCISSSRSFYVSQAEPSVLAPILSLLNPPEPKLLPTVKAELAGGMFFAKRKLVITAKKDVREGDSVTVSYGQSMRNAELAFVKGLTIEDSRYNSVSLSFELSSLDRFYEDKQDILASYDGENNPKFEIVGGSQSGEYEAPEDMDSFLRLLCLTGTDAFLLEGIFRGEVWDFMGLPVSAENEKALCELVINASTDLLEEYSDAFSQMEENDITERQRIARCIVDGEKGILESLQRTYQRRIDSLDGLEYYAERRLKTLDLLRPIDESEIVDSESGGRVARAFDENY